MLLRYFYKNSGDGQKWKTISEVSTSMRAPDLVKRNFLEQRRQRPVQSNFAKKKELISLLAKNLHTKIERF